VYNLAFLKLLIVERSKNRKKFKKITFKLSESEYNYLQTCAMLDKTTNNKIIKKFLRTGFETMRERVVEWEKQKQPINQLDLFAWLKDPEFEQSSLLSEDEFFYNKKEEKDG